MPVGGRSVGGGANISGRVVLQNQPTNPPCYVIRNPQSVSKPQQAVFWTPAAISTALWLDAADASTITLSGTQVATWADKSGNGNNGTASGAPEYAAAQLNGLNLVTFPSGGGCQVSHSSILSGAYTCVYLVWPLSPNVGEAQFFHAGNNLLTGSTAVGFASSMPVFSDGASAYNDDTSRREDAYPPAAAPQILTFEPGRILRDGTEVAAYSASGSPATANLTIIGRRADVTTQFFIGHIAEIVACTTLTDADRRRVEGYLAWKWGVVANLAADHPYKFAPPMPLVNTSMPATPGVYTLTGTATRLLRGFSLPGNVGSYAITGTATNLKYGRRLPANVGAYAITGTATGLLAQRRLVASVGSYSLTGTATRLLKGYRAPLNVGAYSLSGVATGLKVARRLPGAVGSYAINGTATALSIARRVPAAVGSYAINGQPVTLTYTPNSAAYVLPVTPGVYALSGQPVSLPAARILAAAVGGYALSGQAVIVGRQLRLQAAPGSYAYTGNETTLSIARIVFFKDTAPVAIGITGASRPASPISIAVAVDPSPPQDVELTATVSPPQAFTPTAAPTAVELED